MFPPPQAAASDTIVRPGAHPLRDGIAFFCLKGRDPPHPLRARDRQSSSGSSAYRLRAALT